jgi:hypothetical protein
MKLDVGALFLVGVPMALVFGLLHFAFWLRWRRGELLWWASSNGVGSAAVLLLLARELHPTWIAARPVAETALFASGLLLWLGFRRHAGQPLPLRSFTACTVLYLVLFQALHSFFPDLAALIVLASFGHGLVHAGAAFDLARARRPDPLRVRAIVVVVFALHALFYLFRSATAVTVEAGADFLHTDGLQSATLLFGLVDVLIWNAAALWMAAERRRDFVAAEAIA